MRGSKQDLPVDVEIDEASIRTAEWGGMNVELSEFRKRADVKDYHGTDLFKGLPDDRCQCPHWGYVIKGQLRWRFADREEVCNAGDAYYVGPGHTPVVEAGTEYVEFSPADKLKETMEVFGRNFAALQGKA